VNAISEEARQDKEHWEALAAQYDMPAEFHAAHARTSGLNIALGYTVGGLVPLIPYFFLSTVEDSLKLSLVVTVLCLLIFGLLKARYTAQNPASTAFRYILTGATAAIAGYFVAGLFI
jgi:VIT1/CCC1 family predicted Fe2+/Mn2+ transporter